MNKIRLEKHEDILIVYFSGEMDSLNVLNYRNVLASEIESHVYKVVLMDFNGVTFMDSSGIGLVLGRYNQIKEEGGTLYLTGLNKMSYRLFDLTGLFKIIDYIQDKEEILIKAGEVYESNEN